MSINDEHKLAQMIIRAWPFPHGSGRLVDRFLSHLVFSGGPKTVKTTDGFDLTVDPNDLIGRHVYLKGEFDRAVVDILYSFAEPGDTLLDIGANIGYVSSCFLSKVKLSRVISVEPQPRILNLLRDNLARFPSDRYTILPFALSSTDGEAIFETSTTNSGAGRIVSVENASTMTVQTHAAERLFHSGHFDGCNIVKIDVEGHEEQVFHSCRSAFQHLKPRAIVFEEHGSKAAPDGSIGTLLNGLGYRVFGIKKYLTKLRLVQIRAKSDCLFNDYIGIGERISTRAQQLYGISSLT